MYKQIFENIPQSVVITEQDFSIKTTNAFFDELSLYTDKELIGNNIYNLFQIQNDFQEDEVFENELITKDNKKIPVKVKFKKVDTICIFLITELSENINLNQTHIDFISTVSHELRTPLTSIKGFADTLLTAGDKLDSEKQKRFITIIKNQIERLTRLVENLLTVSKLESKKAKSVFKSINLNDFFDELLVSLTSKLVNHNVILQAQENIQPVWADSDKLEQIMTNLIDNAVKYSAENSTIKIVIKEINAENISIEVIDQGIGISSDHLQNIFTKFSRIDNPLTRKVEGTGLGLYITKSLVDTLNGRIDVKTNEPSEGTTFRVTLPIATQEKYLDKQF